MCDYSLQGVASRPAAVGDKLITRNFGTGTRGFGASEDRNTAVCLLPGTEIAFASDVAIESPRFFGQSVKTLKHSTAIFRQLDKETPHVHHDALEFPDGQIVLLTSLREGQHATVLQLPAKPTTQREVEEQRRAAFTG
jgi:hypothetical protein